jgi:hypothetical protein
MEKKSLPSLSVRGDSRGEIFSSWDGDGELFCDGEFSIAISILKCLVS